MAKPVARFETVQVRAAATDSVVAGLVERNHVIVVEDERKLQAAVAAGQRAVVSAETATELWQQQRRYKRVSCCCFVIALILAIVFGVAMGEWRRNATSLQSSVLRLRDELQSDVFYTSYDNLVDACLSSTYAACYEVGVNLDGFTVSLAKSAEDTEECLVSDAYQCTIREYQYSATASDNCVAAEYDVNSRCELVTTKSSDSCSWSEQLKVLGGGGYFSSSDACSVTEVADDLESGDQVACNDCAVVIRLENVITNTENLF